MCEPLTYSSHFTDDCPPKPPLNQADSFHRGGWIEPRPHLQAPAEGPSANECCQVSLPRCFSASLQRPTRTKGALPDIVSPPPFHGGVGLLPNSCSLGARVPSKLSLGISGTATHRAILFPLAAVSTHPAAEQPASTRPLGSLLTVGKGRLSGAVQ